MVLAINETLAAIILAVIQGLSEWFPISSSGHLVLFEKILGFNSSLVFDVALHFGTLMAVFVYFGKDITDIIKDIFSGKWGSENGRLGLLLIVGSIPAGLVGWFVADFFDSVLRNLWTVALGFAITGIFLFIASLDFRNKEGKIGFGKAFLIGVSQAFAIIPGVSRSGATISSGVLLGLNEKAAMKFAFLLSIPVIFGANILTIGNNPLPPNLIWATLVSFVVGLASIHVVFRYVLVNKKNFRWFGAYCLLLALGLGLWLIFS